MNNEKIKAFITKYALTGGIKEVEGTISEHGYLHVKDIYSSFSRKEYFFTREEALKDAEERRKKKIKSLEKQIAQMQNMKFEK